VPVSVILAIGCGVVWIGVTLWTRWRPSNSLPIDYAGPVPEPVRMVLRPGARREGGAILNAAILELAEAGVLRIDPADSQGPAMVSPQALPHASQLIGYQASVVSRLLHRQGVSRMPVPLTALQPDEDPTALKWHREFHRQLQRSAADRGLMQRPLGSTRFVAMLLTGLLVSDLAANALSHYWHGQSGLTLFEFIGFTVAVFALLAWAGQTRPTSAGRTLAAAPAAPTDPAPAARRPDSTLVMQPVPEIPEGAPDVRVLPTQLQPLPKNQVWSAYGGAWHPLDLNTKETYAIRKGSPVILIPVFFAIISLVGAFIAKRNGDPTGTVSFTFFSALPLIVVVFLVLNSLRRRHLPKRAVIRGQVAKLWEIKHSTSEGESRDYYCSLDVGRGPESVRLKINGGLFRRMQVGAEVEILVNPRRRSLKDIRFITPEEQQQAYA
jgi:hypothetical protein